MNELKIYETLTYVECYDWEVIVTPTPLEQVEKLRRTADKFIRLGNELVAIWNIKNVKAKTLSPVEQVIYSVEDKFIRDKLKADIDKRLKDWLRVNVEIVQNLLSKYQ